MKFWLNETVSNNGCCVYNLPDFQWGFESVISGGTLKVQGWTRKLIANRDPRVYTAMLILKAAMSGYILVRINDKPIDRDRFLDQKLPSRCEGAG
jgi:hypothetical protein